MKSLTKAIAAASLATVATAAQAGVSTTVGGVSDYYFRGANLGDAAAYVSLDFEMGGFYAGVWAIDDGASGCTNDDMGTTANTSDDVISCANGNDGLETDFYVGYAWENDVISLGIGYTLYEYTYTRDLEHELNLSFGVAGFGLDVALGTDDDEGSAMGDQADYQVIELSYSSDVWGVKLGQKYTEDSNNYSTATGGIGALTGTGESEYKWAEFSASKEVGGFDFTATIGRTFDIEAESVPVPNAGVVRTETASDGGEYIFLDVSKSFDLM